MKLTDKEKELVEFLRENNIIKWHEPFACVSSNGLYVSLAEDEEACGVIKWREFEDILLSGLCCEIEEHINDLERVVARLKRRYKREGDRLGNLPSVKPTAP